MSLKNLETIHSRITGGTPGRKWITEEVNHAAIVRVAGEFQGFCRDLYVEGASAVASSLPDPGMSNLLSIQMNTGLRLHRVNAQPASLAEDFGRFGFKFWDEIEAVWPTRGPVLKGRLELLNTARNAIAHQDAVKLAQVRAQTSLVMADAKRWRSNMDELSRVMDNVVGAQIATLIGRAPW